MTTLTRSTIAISDFVRASRKLAALKLEAVQAERMLAELKNEVLEQIGTGRTVKVDGAIAELTPRVSESISRTCDDATAVEFFEKHGLKISQRSEFYVAPATFTAAVKRGEVARDLFTVTTTTDVNVI